MRRLDQIRALLANGIDGVLDPAVGDDGDDGRVDDAQFTNTVDLERRIDDALVDGLGQARGAARVEGGLAAVEDGALHGGVVVEGHGPGVLVLDDIREPVAAEQQVVRPADALAHGDDVELVGEEVQVDVRLRERVGAFEPHRPAVRHGPHKVHHHRGVAAPLRDREVPLEGGAEHAHEVELEVRLALGREGVAAAVGRFGLAVAGSFSR